MRSWLGAILIAAAGFWCGNELVQRLRRQRLALEEAARLLQKILDDIQYRNLPVRDILHHLQNEDSYSFFDLSAIQKLQDLSPPNCLSGEVRTRLTQGLSQLGQQGLQCQCEQLVREIQYLQERAKELREKERASAAVFPKIGFCAGAMMALAIL